MELTVNSGIWGAMFGVPCIVADNFLKLATGGQIKVLLYLLRSSGKPVSEHDIAVNTGVTEQEAAEAVLFWQQANVLTSTEINAESLAPVAPLLQISQQNVSASVPATRESVPAPELRRVQLQPSEIAKMMKDSRDISELFRISESTLGTLTHSMQNSLIQLYEYFGLKKEVIITLLTYCAQIEKTDCRYIERVGADWSDKGINTLSGAQKEVQRLAKSHDYTVKIMKLFEMDRRPTTKQAGFIEKWQQTGFDTELVKYAYEKAVENTGKLSFPYIDKVLMTWRDSGCMTVQEVQSAELDYKSRRKPDNSGGVPSDIDKYNVVIDKF
ncbi:MAG: DnaD domain protein [Ruminococcus sp.]|nr:DnaD domain protein [Ruminococcus sp.]